MYTVKVFSQHIPNKKTQQIRRKIIYTITHQKDSCYWCSNQTE